MSDGQEKTVLIVEDDEKIATAISVRLKSEGYRVVLAGDGVHGVSFAVKHAPDNPKYRFQLGVHHANHDRFEEAQRAFSETLRLDPRFPKAGEYLEIVEEILREEAAP